MLEKVLHDAHDLAGVAKLGGLRIVAGGLDQVHGTFDHVIKEGPQRLDVIGKAQVHVCVVEQVNALDG